MTFSLLLLLQLKLIMKCLVRTFRNRVLIEYSLLPTLSLSLIDLSLEMARVSVSQTSPPKSSTQSSSAVNDDITRQPSVDTLVVEPTLTPTKAG